MLKVQVTTNNEGTFLNLPSIPDDVLPTVTVVTPTYNRKNMFDIAIRNYKNFNYPREKLQWIILDDSPTDSLKNIIPDDNTIRYIHNTKKECIGAKRNRLASESKTEVICHMDDDDYYYPDSIKIRIISMLAYKRAVCGCIEYNCYNLIDDSQFIARGQEELMNIGEASLCYLKSFWETHKYNDEDTHEESMYFLKDCINDYVDVPCFWTLLSITHGSNASGRRAIAPVLHYSFLDMLSVNDYEYIKSIKMKSMMENPVNLEAINIVKKIQNSHNKEKIIDKLSLKYRKNIFIRELLNTIPSKTSCSNIDYLILCFPGQFIKELDLEKETKLVNYIKEHKNNYRFTIFTDCEKGYTFEGITVSPWWKWRTCNKYHNCLVYADPSHIKLNISAKHIYIYNKYDLEIPEMKKGISVKTFDELKKVIKN